MNMILRLIAILAAALIAANAAHAQSLRAGSFLGNPSSSARSPTDATASQMFDRNFGSTNGYMIKRQNGTWQGVPGVTINVMEAPYNATCNGSANDTTAINAAITAAFSAGGGVVTAPPEKVCIVQSGTTVTLLNNVYLKGIYLRGTSATNNTEMVVAAGRADTGVIDSTIDMIDSFVTGNHQNAAISMASTTNFLVQNVKILRRGNFGIIINGGSAQVLNNRLEMSSPYGTVTGVGQQNNAILVACSATSYGRIDGNVSIGGSIALCDDNWQVTNNKVSLWRYGAGISISSSGGGGLNVCTFTCVGSLIGFNEISNGFGIDSDATIVPGIEVFSERTAVIGNTIWRVSGNAIHGGAAQISNNVIFDNCTYYAQVASIVNGCYGIFIRKDFDDGSNTIVASNRVFNSFGATLNVTGTTNSAGVIRITVASTATIGATSTSVPCQVKNVGGTTAANGGWLACVVKSSTSIELTGSTFNSAWTSGGTIGGLQDYSYGDNDVNLTNIRLTGNVFGPGFLGTYNITANGPTSEEPRCSAPCTATDGTIPIGSTSLGNFVSRNVSGDATLSTLGVLTLATVNSNVGTFGSATQVGQFTVNAKGLITAASGVTVTPAVGSITGLGTGVATALGVNVGSAGAFVTFNGALGTPSSGTLTNATGLPVSSGISGLGTSVATALAVNVGTAGAFVVNGGALGSPSSAGTLPAHTLGGAVTGNSQNITGLNNLTSTTATFGNATDAVTANVAAGSLARVASFLSPSMSNDQRVYMTIGTANSSNNAFFFGYNHNSTSASRYFAIQPFEGGFGQYANFYADGGFSFGNTSTSPGFGNVVVVGSAKSSHATAGIGYATGAGGAVTQGTSRTTGVTLNTVSGAITLVSAAGSTTPASFTVTNSAVAATDVVKVVQKSGTDIYEIFVTAVAAGSFRITFFTTGGTTTEQPVFNFVVIKGVAS